MNVTPELKQHMRKGIHNSQHCQRNWDLSKPIPQEDIDLIIESAIECPTKQNLNFYKVVAITDRKMIEAIYEQTDTDQSSGRSIRWEDGKVDTVMMNNPQTLANVLLAWVEDTPSATYELSGTLIAGEGAMIPDAYSDMRDTINSPDFQAVAEMDRLISIGIASGYAAWCANMLGYKTGFCKCFEDKPTSDIIGEGNVKLLLGVGHGNPKKNRLEHHEWKDFYFASAPNRTQKVIWKT
ncbi:MAG: hypothetical protein CMD98_06460 [Gammaproteobacteria bacterium]|nr:hypothetical protein [Gammaproteobacteria bacterium]